MGVDTFIQVMKDELLILKKVVPNVKGYQLVYMNDLIKHLGSAIESGEKFMRKGKVGDWANYFTPELEKKFTEWEKRGLKNSNLKFKYKI